MSVVITWIVWVAVEFGMIASLKMDKISWGELTLVHQTRHAILGYELQEMNFKREPLTCEWD